VHDGTGSAWPVQSKATYWNASAVDVGYGCHTNYHCVPVMEGKYGGTGWLSQTSYRVDQFHRFTYVSVQFNDSYSTTAAEKAEAVCHELGHVAGLGYESSNVSCMNAVADGTHEYASNDDFDQLAYHTYNGTT